MSIDEIGIKTYGPVNSDTMNDITYHFNYFIMLMTGIFDSLAIFTKKHYQLFEYTKKISANKISLRSKSGQEFLKALELKNSALRRHIHDNSDLINAPYLLRELIAHRESLHPQHFVIDGVNTNFLFVSESFVDCLRRLGDKQVSGGCSKFGVYSENFLSPYLFAKAIAVLLTKFCYEFLQFLGFNNVNNKKLSISKGMAEDFEDSLGF